MHKEKPILFAAPFMKKYGIKGFPVDPRTMDIAEGQFIEELMDSLKAKYDSTKPILVAKCETDERCDGYVVDGRHRLYCLAKMKEKGVPLPSPFPMAYIDVKDANHLRALIAQYEERNRSKGGKYAKAWIEENLGAIIEDNLEVKGDKIGEYIKSLGFTNTAIISKMVDTYMGPSKKPRKQKTRHVAGLPESLQSSWKEENDKSVYAGKDERFDTKISYKPCPDCKQILKILTDLQGTVLKVEAAPKIKN